MTSLIFYPEDDEQNASGTPSDEPETDGDDDDKADAGTDAGTEEDEDLSGDGIEEGEEIK